MGVIGIFGLRVLVGHNFIPGSETHIVHIITSARMVKNPKEASQRQTVTFRLNWLIQFSSMRLRSNICKVL